VRKKGRKKEIKSLMEGFGKVRIEVKGGERSSEESLKRRGKKESKLFKKERRVVKGK
jgi:hypothetical protein